MFSQSEKRANLCVNSCGAKHQFKMLEIFVFIVWILYSIRGDRLRKNRISSYFQRIDVGIKAAIYIQHMCDRHISGSGSITSSNQVHGIDVKNDF